MLLRNIRHASRLLILVLLISACSASHKTEKTDLATIDRLKAHIGYLADDKLEGRRTGTAGEHLAMTYIETQFRDIGLIPKGTDNYIQPFPVNDGKQIGAGTRFSINGTVLEAGKDYFPFPYNPQISIEALPAVSLQEWGMPWFVDLKDKLEENQNNPHFDLTDYIHGYTKTAKEKGASALVLFNSTAIDDKLAFDPKDKQEKTSIPLFYVNKAVAKKYFSDKSASLTLVLKSDITDKVRTGHNVVGYIDNGAATTVILGAHFDHLGYGEDGNSMLRTGEKLIHNGADDNASGTAALIELARKLKTDPAKGNNYLFIAFSGEELGLFGSKYYSENPTIDLKTVNYMINMDMVGRLNDSSRVVTLGGYGTSPTWSEVLTNPAKAYFTYRFDSSGTGPSDHTSFYRKDIPVLFYFTGLHTDYHKPSDDADKINYKGEAMIIGSIQSLIGRLNGHPKLAFLKTKETQTSTSARRGVTMGIVPDYTFSGTGVRADGVTDGRPAQAAGVKTGDIIIQLGEYPVNSMEGYMQALGNFKKGDSAKVKLKRGAETLELTVTF
jgi:aminopeptidase YwaD